jgi:hypothetical protein
MFCRRGRETYQPVEIFLVGDCLVLHRLCLCAAGYASPGFAVEFEQWRSQWHTPNDRMIGGRAKFFKSLLDQSTAQP